MSEIDEAALEFELEDSPTFWKSIDKIVEEYPAYRTVVVDLEEFDDVGLATAIAEDPETAENMVREMATDIIKKYRPDVDEVKVEFRNSPLSIDLRDVSVELEGRLLTVEGIVRRVDDVVAEVARIRARCTSDDCGTEFVVERDVVPPEIRCPTCGSTRVEILEYEFTDLQRVTLQEVPELHRKGGRPASVEVEMRSDLVNRLQPGDRVKLTGIPEIKLDRPKPRPGDTGKIVLNARGVDHTESSITEEMVFTESEIEEFREIAEGDPLETVASTVAPHIHGHDDIKRAVALQLFSCVPEGRVRERIHILVVGDPATAKSQILQFVAQELAPRGVYVSAQHVTGAGLTAAAERTEDGWTLEAGAVVLADGGLVAIDELDKASRHDLNALLEAMESGKISVAKAGITATLKARCAVLAAANPEGGRWDPSKHPLEQVNVDPALLSRFDAVFVTRDVPDPEKDEAIAETMVEAYSEGSSTDEDLEVIRRFVSYATSRTDGLEVTEEAKERLKEWFVEKRKDAADAMESGGVTTLPVTRRQMGSVIRFARAHARMRLSDTVEEEDVNVAISVVEDFMNQVLVDEESGTLDADLIETGKTLTHREARTLVLETVRKLAEEFEDGVPRKEVCERLKGRLKEGQVTEILEELKEEGELMEPYPGHYKPF